MTLENRANGRVYVRRFDHDEARARHAAGEKITALAAEYGVAVNAVYYAVTPDAQAKAAAYDREWRTGTCEVCGGAACRLVAGKKLANPDGRVLCAACRSKERRKCVIVGAFDVVASVRCVTCGEWKDPGEFPRGSRYRDLREGGFHSQCRTCQATVRQAYRERHKIPCVRCGQPRLPASEKGPRGRRDSGLCVACYRREEAGRPAAAATRAPTRRPRKEPDA